MRSPVRGWSRLWRYPEIESRSSTVIGRRSASRQGKSPAWLSPDQIMPGFWSLLWWEGEDTHLSAHHRREAVEDGRTRLRGSSRSPEGQSRLIVANKMESTFLSLPRPVDRNHSINECGILFLLGGLLVLSGCKIGWVCGGQGPVAGFLFVLDLILSVTSNRRHEVEPIFRAVVGLCGGRARRGSR